MIKLTDIKKDETFMQADISDPDYHLDLMYQITQSDILDPSDNLFPWSMIPWLSLSPLSGGFSDSDLTDVSKDDTYKPDNGKGT